MLCNIYQSLDVRSERSASLERTKTSFWIKRDPERDLFGKSFETAGQENYLLCVYRDFYVGN